ncbi:MAG TPA: hypothetical protein VJY54_08370 [Lachnospiraceae bacterium]|nr:hypothetical protein [Lachnospiraceae bacterium]
MPYSIQFQSAALLLMGATGALLTEKMAIRLHTQKSYIALYISVLVSIFADILSVIFIVESDVFGLWETSFVCKIYLVSIVLVGFFLWQYTLTEIHHEKNIWLKSRTLLGVLPIISELVIVILFPIQIYHEGVIVYTYGFCVQITYWCAFFYLLVTLLYTFVFYKNISKYVCNSIWFLIGIWVLAALIQMFNNSILIVGFAMSVAMVFMYIKLENPTAYIDNEVHVYNSYAYTEYLQKQFDTKKRIWIASLRVEGIHSVNENFSMQGGRELLCMIVHFLKQTGKKISIYRTGMATFSIFYTDEKELINAVNKIEARFQNPWCINGMYIKLESHVAYLDDSSLVNSANELMDVLHYFVKDRG